MFLQGVDDNFKEDFGTIFEKRFHEMRDLVAINYLERTLPLYRDLNDHLMHERKIAGDLRIRLENAYELLLLITSSLLDLYTISRMFRTYKQEEHNKKCFVPKYPQNILIYVGEQHAEEIVKILVESNRYELKHEIQSASQYRACIQIPSKTLLPHFLIKSPGGLSKRRRRRRRRQT